MHELVEEFHAADLSMEFVKNSALKKSLPNLWGQVGIENCFFAGRDNLICYPAG